MKITMKGFDWDFSQITAVGIEKVFHNTAKKPYDMDHFDLLNWNKKLGFYLMQRASQFNSKVSNQPLEEKKTK